jgi:hypothetical protein
MRVRKTRGFLNLLHRGVHARSANLFLSVFAGLLAKPDCLNLIGPFLPSVL